MRRQPCAIIAIIACAVAAGWSAPPATAGAAPNPHATAGAAATPTTPASRPGQLRTFDAETVGVAPTGAIVRGSAVVAAAPFGGSSNRAVHVLDASTTTDSSVLFPAAAGAAREWGIDLAPHQVRPFEIAVHGSRAGADAIGYRLSIGPVYNFGRSSAAQLSVYTTTTAQKLAVIPDLTDQDRPTRLTLTASADALIIRVGHFSFRTTAHAGAVDAVTGIEFRSSGVSATGTDVYLDNLTVADRVARGTFAAGIAAVGTLEQLTAGRGTRPVPVATINDPGVRSGYLTARVYVGGRWVNGEISGRTGHLIVKARLAEPDIGLQPVTVTITDRRTGLLRSTQLRTQSYAPIRTSVVVQEAPGIKDPRFADAVRLQDGRIMVVYHLDDGHTQANGVLRVVSSPDGGRTWTAPETVVANEYDNRDPKIMQLRDGTILISMFRTNWAAGGANVGTFLVRSTDGGRTFGSDTRIDGAKPGTYEHAPAVELPNGDVLQPLYGSGARLARSTDGGRTFPATNEITVVADDAQFVNQEPNLVALPNGELVMVIRTLWNSVGANRYARIVRSFDGGHTWTAPEFTDLPASSHHLLVTKDGSVLMTFGNILQPDRPTYAALITSPSGPWLGYRQVPVYNAGAGDDQANPSDVQLSDGSLLSFGYNTGERTVVSWRTRARTYH